MGGVDEVDWENARKEMLEGMDGGRLREIAERSEGMNGRGPSRACERNLPRRSIWRKLEGRKGRDGRSGLKGSALTTHGVLRAGFHVLTFLG